jgi:hypothetical protein
VKLTSAKAALGGEPSQRGLTPRDWFCTEIFRHMSDDADMGSL